MAIKTSETIPASQADYGKTRIIERPDGFYCQHIQTGEESGPFATRIEAAEEAEYGNADIELGESLQEAESEIGIADWIDPETGQPAEEFIPHIEDH